MFMFKCKVCTCVERRKKLQVFPQVWWPKKLCWVTQGYSCMVGCQNGTIIYEWQLVI
jgi:hypothetical protein